MTTPNAVTHSYTYDTLNRLRTLNVVAGGGDPGGPTVIHAYDYSLRASGHRASVTETATRFAQAGSKTYTYDDLYRLTGETVVAGVGHPGLSGTVAYDLDKVGNRLNRTSNVANVLTRSDTYNNRDLLDSDTYDTNGNTTVGGVGDTALNGTDTYDFEDRLIHRLKADASSIAISYDADGIRRQKVLFDNLGGNISTTNYLVDTNNHTGYAQVLEERISDASGTTVKTYTYGTDLIAVHATESAATTTSYYTYDGGGTVRELTDVTGAITDSYDYDAYGILIFSAGPTDNAYLYRGEQFDQDIGLYYLRARFMNPESGRFWNMDVFEGMDSVPPTLHKFLYASSDPVSGLDPSGFITLTELKAVVNISGRTLGRLAKPTFRSGKKAAERIICKSSTASLKRIRGLQGHHRRPKFLGGNPKQDLLWLDKETHRAFHLVLHLILKSEGLLGGLGGRGNGVKDWQRVLANPKNREAAEKAIVQASKFIDGLCGLKKPANLSAIL